MQSEREEVDNIGGVSSDTSYLALVASCTYRGRTELKNVERINRKKQSRPLTLNIYIYIYIYIIQEPIPANAG